MPAFIINGFSIFLMFPKNQIDNQYYKALCLLVCVCVCIQHIIMNDSNCFDKVTDVGSWWNFQRCFLRMIPIIWYQLHVHQEPKWPPWLQEETWRTGGVLTGFLMLDLDETFTEASERLFLMSTQTPGSSGTSVSSLTPGRDLEDRRSLDRVPDLGCWWIFHRSFWSMIHIIWHHLLLHQELPCPTWF